MAAAELPPVIGTQRPHVRLCAQRDITFHYMKKQVTSQPISLSFLETHVFSTIYTLPPLFIGCPLEKKRKMLN